MAKFRTISQSLNVAETPASLFHDLSNRSDEIKYLWAHQKEVLDKYHSSHLDNNDVAIELPTGAGKTLIGLLIAEYRRCAKKERIAYLCPTRQLAKQVYQQAKSYGIPVFVFTGKQRNYEPSEFASYQQGQAIAITTYSAVFNINPRIDSPQVLIFDDAHSCETYVTGMWSLEMQKAEYVELFNDIIDMFRVWLPESFMSGVEDGQYNRVELIPGYYFREKIARLLELFDKHFAADSPEYYALCVLRDNLHACNLFLTPYSLLIRPVIPPTLTHSPFSNATQRIYMSATLGDGGELERIVGVKNIQRIPLPSDWENRGTGRRLFLIPELSLSSDEAFRIVNEIIAKSNRALVLAPTRNMCEQLACDFQNNGISVFRATDIEDGVGSFAKTDKAALILSRYDGIDLPDHQCRLLVFSGKPGGVNLQERFFMTRVAASALLRDRILTRFTQGVGRCTRSDQDYSIVTIFGQDMIDFLLKLENRSLIHSELQAELEFGIDNSKGVEANIFVELVQEFLGRTENWNEAEQHIVSHRRTKERGTDPFVQNLKDSTNREIDYLYKAWDGHWDLARDCAKQAFEALSGDGLSGYQGWWIYLTGDAELAHSTLPENFQRSRQYFAQAAHSCPSLSWLSQLKELSEDARATDNSVQHEDLDVCAAESINLLLSKWGFHGSKFEDKINAGIAQINSDSHADFHQGLEFLGKILGFEAYRPNGTGEPDCIWIIGHTLYIIFEAKSEQNPDGTIGKNDVQQAQGHENWVQQKHSPRDAAQLLPIIISPRCKFDTDVKIHASTLCHIKPEDVREIATRSVECIGKIRNNIAGIDNTKVLIIIQQHLKDFGLLPMQVYENVSAKKVQEI